MATRKQKRRVLVAMFRLLALRHLFHPRLSLPATVLWVLGRMGLCQCQVLVFLARWVGHRRLSRPLQGLLQGEWE